MSATAEPFNLRKFLLSGSGWPYLLVPFIADRDRAGRRAGRDPIIVFFASALGVVPTAALMGRATEELAHRSGPGIGGLLNVTFGNAPELIIALFALDKGLHEVVKASIIGSILGNLLLVMGAAMLVGGWGRERQTVRSPRPPARRRRCCCWRWSRWCCRRCSCWSSGGGLPAARRRGDELPVRASSTCRFAVAIVLLLSYVAGLWFSLKTHRDVFNPRHARSEDDAEDAWSVTRSVGACSRAPAWRSA